MIVACYRRHEMRPRDTSARAAAMFADLNRAAAPSQRFLQALEVSDLLREMAKAGLRARHPEYSEEELLRALARQMYQDVLSRSERRDLS